MRAVFVDADETLAAVARRLLRPDDPRLKVESRPTVVVPAGQSTNVPVQVRAIGSGNVDIQVEVLRRAYVLARQAGADDGGARSDAGATPDPGDQAGG